MTPDTTPIAERAFETDDQLHDMLGHLLSRASIRQIWLFFFGADHRLMEPIMPMDDHPISPDEMCDTEDLGRLPFGRVFAERMAWITEFIGAASVVVVWERVGPPKPTVLDLEWARTVGREAERLGMNLRAQFMLHNGGVRQLTGAELRGSAA